MKFITFCVTHSHQFLLLTCEVIIINTHILDYPYVIIDSTNMVLENEMEAVPGGTTNASFWSLQK